MTVYLDLYSTSHCHLCVQAESLLSELAKEQDLQWSIIEIAYDTALLDLYELKIPVLKRRDTNMEINWPFSANEIRDLIT